MAVRARLSAPKVQPSDWRWHTAKWMALPASIAFGGDRRLEAENYLAGGYGVRLSLEASKAGLMRLGDLAKVWQPSRLKGIQVDPAYGNPFMAATQIFDLRPVPRKWLSLDRTLTANDRLVSSGMILVTCSGAVGRATLAQRQHEGVLVSHDLLRVESKRPDCWGWIYAYLRSPQARAMMNAVQYGHIIKHLETAHLDALPLPVLRDGLLLTFQAKMQAILDARNSAHDSSLKAEEAFENAIGRLPAQGHDNYGFSTRISSIASGRRRFEGAFHSPITHVILDHFACMGLRTIPLAEAGFDLWLPTRFRRISAEDGVDLLDSSDLFEINPDIARRISDGDFGDRNRGRVRAGWLLVARSGQAYGLNGSVTIATAFHEGKVVSDDVIRVAPRPSATLRAGYLYVAMSHPTLGRPLVKRMIYGSSIPHLEVTDLEQLQVVRLDQKDEDAIADLSDHASALRAKADILENEVTAEASAVLDRFIAGATDEVVCAAS